MISPALFSFEKAAADNNYITGPLVITFAIMALWEVNRSARWLTLFAGVWLLIAPFVLGVEDSSARWITMAAGILLIAFSLIKGKIKGSYGGGWRSLFQDSEIN